METVTNAPLTRQGCILALKGLKQLLSFMISESVWPMSTAERLYVWQRIKRLIGELGEKPDAHAAKDKKDEIRICLNLFYRKLGTAEAAQYTGCLGGCGGYKSEELAFYATLVNHAQHALEHVMNYLGEPLDMDATPEWEPAAGPGYAPLVQGATQPPKKENVATVAGSNPPPVHGATRIVDTMNPKPAEETPSPEADSLSDVETTGRKRKPKA